MHRRCTQNSWNRFFQHLVTMPSFACHTLIIVHVKNHLKSDKLSTFGFAQMKRLIISIGSLLKLSSDDSTRIAAFQFSSKGKDFLKISHHVLWKRPFLGVSKVFGSGTLEKRDNELELITNNWEFDIIWSWKEIFEYFSLSRFASLNKNCLFYLKQSKEVNLKLLKNIPGGIFWVFL